MKRKPILFNKAVTLHKGQGREVIGLIGTHHGAGVTYTGLMLAFYMGEELGKRTALLECNNHHDMALIQKAYEWSREDSRCFSFHRVTCFKEVSQEHIAGIFGENYECMILDFGINFVENREEFLRCTTKIVVSGRAQWNLQKFKLFTEMAQTVPGSEAWLYFIPQADKSTVTKLTNEILRKVRAVPESAEPTLPSRDTSRFFGTLF